MKPGSRRRAAAPRLVPDDPHAVAAGSATTEAAMPLIKWLLLPALARAASHDMAAAVVREDPDAECRADCKTVHRRLHAQTLCAKRTRTLAAQKRSEASNSCLAAFNRGVTDECFDSCVAAANGAEWHPGARPRDVYDQRGRPCTSAQNWDHCRAGYEAAVEQTRALFFAPEPEPEPEPEPRRRLEEKKAPVLEAATAHVKDVGRGTGAVEDVVVVQYEGSQVPLVVREDQSLGAATSLARIWLTASPRPMVGASYAFGFQVMACFGAQRGRANGAAMAFRSDCV